MSPDDHRTYPTYRGVGDEGGHESLDPVRVVVVHLVERRIGREGPSKAKRNSINDGTRGLRGTHDGCAAMPAGFGAPKDL